MFDVIAREGGRSSKRRMQCGHRGDRGYWVPACAGMTHRLGSPEY